MRRAFVGLLSSPIIALGTALMFAGSPSQAAETVNFASAAYTLKYSAFRIKQAKKQGIELEAKSYPSVPLTGTLERPAGPGPFPAVVLMHGCAGVEVWNRAWTKRLVGWGYVVLNVDSFTPRGLSYICDGREISTATPWTRALDAFGAMKFLSTVNGVDPARMAVIGMSHGGASVLHVIERATADGVKSKPFRAAVALYPLCRELKRVDTPTLILIGDKDMWTSSIWCEKYVNAMPKPHDVALTVFPGAHHLFDLENIDGEEMGLTLRHHPEAARKAISMIREFLKTRMQ